MSAVETETNTSSYVGIAGNIFKTRYYIHIKTFKTKRNKNETELSRCIWKPKKGSGAHHHVKKAALI